MDDEMPLFDFTGIPFVAMPTEDEMPARFLVWTGGHIVRWLPMTREIYGDQLFWLRAAEMLAELRR